MSLAEQLMEYQPKLKVVEGKTKVFDIIRKKWFHLTPEEYVRQCLLHFFTKHLNYPTSLIAVEKKILFHQKNKRFDLVVYNRQHQPWLLVEVKEPNVPVSNETFHQLLQYNNILNAPFWLLTNGHQFFCADASNKNEIKWLDHLPNFEKLNS